LGLSLTKLNNIFYNRC